MTEKAGCLIPDDVAYNNYDVALTPDLKAFTFAGTVSVNLTVRRPVRTITLHAADLAVARENVLLHPDGAESVQPAGIQLDAEAQTAVLTFTDEIPAGGAVLEIGYSGTLNDKMAGFYRSRFVGPDGVERHLAATQFEATDARRALPCGDEPALKATFDVTLSVPPGLTALSNMPVRAQSVTPEGLAKFTFDRSPVMSSYLLAFIVGELEFIEGTTNNGTRVRVYTVPGKKEHGRFALETAIRVLEFYNEYFGIPYPLPKLDMVAIPDFAAGAMENWGLVTYRENALLIDPEHSASAAYQRVAEVVAHELAHQWFGNLVTMQWWTHLWLNEGFATWMASLAMDALFPEWDIWTQFVGDEYASALSLDGLRSSHAIEVEVGHPNEISQIFDSISYSKGASVIRMIHDFIGPDAFRTGLQNYLRRHAYANATTEDLWEALAEASGKPVRDIMDTWTKQAGYPLITVRAAGDGSLELSQERFLSGGETLTDAESRQTWDIPVALTVLTGGSSKPLPRFSCSGRSFTVKTDMPATAVTKLNAGQITLARVNYPPEQWGRLAESLRENALPPADRYGLISDALSLARAGRLPTGELLNLLASYLNETDYTVWNAALGALGAVANLVEETASERRYDAFACSVLSSVAAKLGWTERRSEAHTTKLLRGQIMGALGAYGDRATTEAAVSAFAGHFAGRRTLNPNLRAAVYATVAKQNLWSDLHIFQQLYGSATLQEERVRLLNAMGRFTDRGILAKVLEFAFDPRQVRSGDFIYVLAGMGTHAQGRRSAWEFITANWEQVSERYSGGGLKMLGRIIELPISGFNRDEDAGAVERFFAEHPAPSATRAIAESLERIRTRAAWYRRDRTVISEFLNRK
ncbi:MAG TPA: M1 family metallopeptidase [Candidatus Paceibacterota bacterium]|nr:M1 family metallopeptidase [Candidatus Paceibacterota bacterium]